jgi:hypothetical protein
MISWRPSAARRCVAASAAAATICLAMLALESMRSAPAAAQEGDQRVTAEQSAAAFLEVYKVLMHPRCMNCHPAGDAPLQGDDSHVHIQLVTRGADGRGKYALKCTNCHQDHNLPGENMPPGNPVWHLPPADMPMVFQGKSPRELAEQLVDPKRNGGKSLEELFHHVAEDQLVLWGWNSGDGRTRPPLSHEEFTKQFRTWLDGGAAAPK